MLFRSPDTLTDIYPHKGPLSGIHSALRVSKNDLICVPVDMPLLDENMLMELVNIGLKTAMIAHYQNQVLPVFIPNTFNSNQYLERVLSSNTNTSLKHFLSHIGCVQIKTKNPRHLINVNTPEQWEQAVKSINNNYQF